MDKHSLTKEQDQRLLEQIEAWAPYVLPPSVTVAIAETLPIWVMVSGLRAALSDESSATGRLHHQLDTGGERLFYARSMGDDEGAPSLIELCKSDLCAEISAALGVFAERNGVRLLECLEEGLTALWGEDRGQGAVVVASRCPTVVMPVGSLMTESEFMARLKEEPPAEGVVFAKEDRKTGSASGR
jgi:hypothetical protein